MKMLLTSQQLVQFKQNGHLRLHDFPLDFDKIKQDPGRDFWRKSPALKKWISHTLGPIALELTRKSVLRLACDQWIDRPVSQGTIKDLFCFQGIAALFCFSLQQGEVILDIFDSSSLSSLLPIPCYVVVFGNEKTVLIENKQDPFTLTTRNLGYVYGDCLVNPFHPLITS